MSNEENIVLFHKTDSPYGSIFPRSKCVEMFSAGWVTGPQYFNCPEEDPKYISKKVESILSRPRERHDILPLDIASKKFLDNDLE